jgi:hypothetical protein
MEFTYSDIRMAMAGNNENVAKLIKQKIAESENAAVALVFDDKLIVLDEENDRFFSVDYAIESVNKHEKALLLKTWEPINFIADNESRLDQLAEEFFDPTSQKEITVGKLVEAFKMKFADEPLKRLLNRTSCEKKVMRESVEKIKALKEIRDVREYFADDIIDIIEDPKIASLYMRISENAPVQSTLSRVDFKSPLSVSLFSESSGKIVNMSEAKKMKKRSMNVKQKVMNSTWTSESFKNDFKVFLNELAEADDAKNVIDNFVKQHVEITILETDELEDLILKTALMIGESMKADSVVTLFKEYYSLDEFQALRDEFIARNNITEDGMMTTEEPVEEEEEEEKSAKETSIDEDSINKILKVLNKINENLKEKTLESRFIKGFVSSLEDAKVGSISEGKLKEILDFLTSIYEEAKSDEEE